VEKHGLDDALVEPLLARHVERYRAQVEIRVVPPVCPLTMAAYDFAGVGETMDRAAELTLAWMGAGGLEADSGELALAPHSHM
jgi:NTE family protein